MLTVTFLYRHLLLIMGIMCIVHMGFSQSFTGLWKGKFSDGKSQSQSEGSRYVLDLEVTGNTINGTSYTYFAEGGKQYYSVCIVYGKLQNATTAIVEEVKRIKTNMIGTSAGLQVHKLILSAVNNQQVLTGTWAKVEKGNTSQVDGSTYLIKTGSKKTLPQIAKLNQQKKVQTLARVETKTIKPAVNNSIVPKNEIAEVNKSQNSMVPEILVDNKMHVDSIRNNASVTKIKSRPNPEIEAKLFLYKKREKRFIQTIYTNGPTVKIDLFDNGEIDGDSISLFFNDQVLLNKQMLKTKALTIYIDIPKDTESENELVMFADNLGTIPPNTALMVITDGDKRYELRITSDLQHSGAIKFITVPATKPR